jgi:hypothetical protein
MTDHATCRSALIESPRPTERTWHCVECGRLLATMDLRTLGVELVDDLWRLPGDHLGMPRFGESPRERRGRGAASAATVKPTRRPAIYVYCPRPGCGVGQHLDG